MADVEEVHDDSLEIMDFQNMKVSDLKKKLKEFGLPMTGNKSELISRLQDACLAEKDDPDASKAKGFESFDNTQISYDENLALSSEENSEIIDPKMYENFTVYSSQEETSGTVTENSNGLENSSVAKPLKKRIIVKNPVSESVAVKSPVSKKLRLNRTHISYADLYPETESVIKSAKTEITIEPTSSKISLSKTVSESEKLAMRAKRFNITSPEVPTSKFSKITSTKPLTSSNAAKPPDVDILKKRAERFGQTVSSVLKQIEEKEKLIKRKCKFGASVGISATSNLDDNAKKLKRAERFGVI